MKVNKTILIITISICLMMGTIFAISYAYIGRASVSGNTNITGNIIDISDGITFTYQLNDVTNSINNISTISVDITDNDLSPEDASNTYSSYVSNIVDLVLTVHLTSAIKTTDTVTCDYSVKFYGNVPTSSAASALGLHQFGAYIPTASTEVPLDGASLPNNYKQIESGTFYVTGTGSTAAINKTFRYDIRFYNLNVDQMSYISTNGSSISGSLQFDADNCRLS